MNRICDDVKTLVERFHGTSLHLNSYLVSATPKFLTFDPSLRDTIAKVKSQKSKVKSEILAVTGFESFTIS